MSGFSVSTKVSTEIHPSYARVSTKAVVNAVSNASPIPGLALKEKRHLLHNRPIIRRL